MRVPPMLALTKILKQFVKKKIYYLKNNILTLPIPPKYPGSDLFLFWSLLIHRKSFMKKFSKNNQTKSFYLMLYC